MRSEWFTRLKELEEGNFPRRPSEERDPVCSPVGERRGTATSAKYGAGSF